MPSRWTAAEYTRGLKQGINVMYNLYQIDCTPAEGVRAEELSGESMGQKQPLIRVTVSLDSQDYAELGVLSEQTEISRSWLIRKAIKDLLERCQEREQLELPFWLTQRRSR